MKNNLILLAIFFAIMLLLNLLFIIKPFFQGVGGCAELGILSCFLSSKLWLIFLMFTLFDFLLYTVVFYLINFFMFILTRSVTANKYFKHIFVFLFIKIVLLTILFFRDSLPINFIYLFIISFAFFYLIEVRLAFNELMTGDSRSRFWVTLFPSGLVGLVKVGFYYVVYPIGLVIVNWKLQ